MSSRSPLSFSRRTRVVLLICFHSSSHSLSSFSFPLPILPRSTFRYVDAARKDWVTNCVALERDLSAFDFIAELHLRGINVRLLNHVLAHIPEGDTFSRQLVLREMACRMVKRVFRSAMHDLSTVYVQYVNR